ncbi:Vacuolar protein sorting-associated protein 29 [Strongyloides ratti]|uniref:Vacuolar protein sorting-associated protein 29 n=1 Tax=Strongyloides ratti TaxID=34506 RepID=A0A090L543_STRRB|nr:Vacuolar protein sorting-associated protein 29 [Strongyloides ratti]CEF64926.1 Vacuolar protein sorting-associated protein 29 [Strongyloides ratti]
MYRRFSNNLVLVIGDFHIPNKAYSLPSKFKKLLVPNKIQHIICTGNLCTKETYDYLRSLASDVHVVRGDCDLDPTYPFTKVISVGDFQIGLTHGHQIIPWGNEDAIEGTARQMKIDVMVTGFTNKCSVKEKGDILYLNPGTATGASSIFDDDSSGSQSTVPSFALMDVQSDVIATYVYKLIDDTVKVERYTFKKPIKVVN